MDGLGVTTTRGAPRARGSEPSAIISQNGWHEAHVVVRKASSVSTLPASATVASGEGRPAEGKSGDGTSDEGI